MTALAKKRMILFGVGLLLLSALISSDAVSQSPTGEDQIRGVQDFFNNSSYELSGFIKLDTNFDLDDAGNRFQFRPRTIPIEGGRGAATTFHVRETRLNLTTATPTELGEIAFRVETDFFGTSGAFRLRHAYGTWGNLLVGQAWSVLVDDDAFIETLDFAGSDGATLVRSPQIRYSLPLAENLLWRFSVEENGSEPVTPAIAGVIRNRIPAFVTGMRIGPSPYHLYPHGVISETRFVPDAGQDQTEVIWALGLSTKFAIGESDILISRLVGGAGAESLISDETISPSGIVVPLSGLEALNEYIWNFAYQHFWRENLRSNFVYGRQHVNNIPSQSGDAIRSVQYLATNLIWRPVEPIDVGVEYLFGQRENKDRRAKDVSRLQLSFIWNLR